MDGPKILSGTKSLFTLASLIVLALALNTWVTGVQKKPNPKERVVEKLYAEDSPVVVADVTVSGKTHKLGERFDRDGDWLIDLSLNLKNVSEKPITFVGLDLDFPETKATGNIMAFPIRFGRNPRARGVGGEPKRLAPDETVSVALSPSDNSDLKTFLEQRHSIASIHKAVVRITEVHFEDGAIWINGSWVRPDPNNLNRLIPVDAP
jgi:hypothetical protein